MRDAEDTFRKAYVDRKDGKADEKKAEELYAAFNKKQEAGLAAAFEIARAGPKSDAGFAALEWVLTNPRSYHLPFGKEAIEFAAAHHAEQRGRDRQPLVRAFLLGLLEGGEVQVVVEHAGVAQQRGRRP